MIHTITIGSDPEFAAFENETPRSAVGFIPGTKKNPFPLDEKGEFSIQIDNVGVEGCIPPANTREEFVQYMRNIKTKCEAKLREVQPNWTIRSVSSARYSEVELDSKIARTFGCEPSYEVYTMGVSPRPTPEEVGNLRSFGFHIHVGFKLNDGDDVKTSFTRIIKAMDILLGVPSLLLDDDEDRRKIYGNAGDLRFRQIKDVNIVEYRTLGGAMHRNDELVGWVYDQTMKAVDMVNSWNNELEDQAAFASYIINNADLENAQAFISSNQIKLPEYVRDQVVA